MSKLKKYLLFTFITVWVLEGIRCCMGSLDSVLPLCMFMPALGLVVFCFYTVAMGIISYHLDVKSGSIWPPAIFHAMINSESSPRMLLGNSHPERSVFGPVDIGLIAMLPMAACAAFLLWYQYKREQLELENNSVADNFSE